MVAELLGQFRANPRLTPARQAYPTFSDSHTSAVTVACPSGEHGGCARIRAEKAGKQIREVRCGHLRARSSESLDGFRRLGLL